MLLVLRCLVCGTALAIHGPGVPWTCPKDKNHGAVRVDLKEWP